MKKEGQKDQKKRGARSPCRRCNKCTDTVSYSTVCRRNVLYVYNIMIINEHELSNDSIPRGITSLDVAERAECEK